MTSMLLAASLFFAGDSTLDDNGFKHPYRSWGRETGFYMKAGNEVRNFAQSGASTKSFRDGGRWTKLIAEVKPGDFVLIEFGHNDQKRSTEFYREKRWADPNGLFREIVRGWVAEVRAKGATPILASPIRRGTFDKEGKKLVDGTHASGKVCLGSYRDAMAELSVELKCDYVDMNTMTKELMERVGKAETEKFFVISTGIIRGKDGEPAHDVTHPIKAGAEAFAQLFVDDVKKRGLSIASLFRDAEFPIDRFGAKADGSKCTAAFAAAFDAAEKAGGGRVVVPKGRWFTGAVRLKSNCELHLAEGADVVFSQDPADYLPAVFTSWEGMECWNYCPLVYAYGCTNVAITGKGTLRGYEGKWADTFWYPWVWQKNGIKAARLQLYTWGATDHPLEDRQIWKMKNANTRPHLVQFNRCANVRLRDFRIRNSPFWTIHLYQCDQASVRGLDVYAHGNNNDGIDIEMSRNVLVEKCRFDQGDDGVVIKSGRNRDAWRIGRPTENVLIRDCEVASGHTVLGVGSEISGGVRNVLMKDCTAGDVYRVFYLKTNRRRGGFLQNIVCENVKARSARVSVFEIATNILYEWADFPDYENRATKISDIKARNIKVDVTKDLIRLIGDPALPPERISWSDVSATSVTGECRRVSNVFVDAASSLDVRMLPGEHWWGVCNDFGREMPFTEKSDFSCDLRLDNYAHQSLSFLCSDKGRAVWCAEPVGVKIAGGKIALESDKGEIVLKENAGRNLGEAFRYASKTWFPPTGEEPELLYFAAPQYNTWIELTYHQNERAILAYAKSMLDHGLPPGVFMIDDTWQHGYGEWEFDARRFSDPKGMVDKLHGMGFKVLLWMCPFVSMDSPAYRRIAFGRNPDDVKGYPTKGGFLVESLEPGWGGVPPPAPVRWWNGRSALLDFTHPNAVAWFGEQLGRLVRDYGVDGFKFDGGGVHFYVGSDGVEGGSPTKIIAHDPSASPSAQSALYGQFALKYKGSEYRNGFGFAGKPVIMRLHDKAHKWDALRRLVPDMLAAGFVGCPFICPDMIGGGEWTAFLPGAPFDPELFIRSAQVHALCPMMQISASPWRVLSPELQRIFKDVVALRQKFAPRFVELAKKSAKTGEPMMRNLEYCFPGMGYADIKDEFIMGTDLLVAPVLEKSAKSRRVVIPPGCWRGDDGKTVEGPATIEVAAPIERLPYFERVSF